MKKVHPLDNNVRVEFAFLRLFAIVPVYCVGVVKVSFSVTHYSSRIIMVHPFGQVLCSRLGHDDYMYHSPRCQHGLGPHHRTQSGELRKVGQFAWNNSPILRFQLPIDRTFGMLCTFKLHREKYP
jgi:hypothetical protein